MEDLKGRTGLSRRSFIGTATVASVGAVAMAASARAAEPAAGQPAAASAPPAPTAAAKAGATGAKKLEEVLKVAREKLYPRCRVCPECDGQACAGEVPGLGGIGSGMSFKNNVTALQKVRLNMRTLHDCARPEVSTTLFGQKLELPVLCASLGGTTYNMGGKMSEEDFIEASLGGAQLAGTMGLVADGTEDPLETYKLRLEAIRRHRGIGVIKPRSQQEILERMRLVEDAGACAVMVDIDSAGRSARAAKLGQVIEPKTPRHLRELVRATKLPFLAKGVMTLDEAKVALDAGCAGVVVSNHGGRCLDHTPGVIEVLPEIASYAARSAVILADGGIRYGHDALKFLAMGAQAVLVGRPIVRGAHGGGPEGVALILGKLKAELIESMTLTGVASVRSVSRSIVTV
ncbi:MAG TPA: alpha-hydroxy-acid oxidizing protein [Anaeromyxobacter sp.]|nr:alpha-hydroxy-acid oxidizing protein [Anaeromyxobacter sp.]